MHSLIKAVFLLVFVLTNFTMEAQEYRSIDGYNNNLINPELGSAGSMISYWTPLDYADGISQPKMSVVHNRPNPRVISNVLFDQDDIIPDVQNLSDYTWVFGQFIDHDITLVENSSFELLDNIVIPEDDEFFLPGTFIPMLRNEAAPGTGTSVDNPRRHINHISSFLDGSSIYGSDLERAEWLRAEEGKLKVSAGDLLPWNTEDGEFNSLIDQSAPFMADDTRSLRKYFVAGDIRANENPLLIGIHTLFVREHNRIAEELKINNPSWDNDKVYFEARKRNIAIYQSIIYNEWLPAMGVNLAAYNGYQPETDPSISNEFSAAAFRVGHTLINGTILRIDNDGETMNQGHIALKDAFFNPYLIPLGGGIEPYFKGMGTQTQQELDCKVIDDVRNFLFGEPGSGGMDLAAININRGRERGLGSFNFIRENVGLPLVKTFQELTDNEQEATLLNSIYQSVDNIDPWVGMLAEKKVNNSIFGETMMYMIKHQFQNLRDGDRFFYINDPDLTIAEKNEISNTTFYDILMRNSSLEVMQKNLFISMPHSDIPNGPELENIDLNAAVFPNPVRENFKLKVYSRNVITAEVTLMTYAGQQLQKRNINLEPGENFIDMELDDNSCPRGLYHIMVRYGDKFTAVKVIKEF